MTPKYIAIFLLLAASPIAGAALPPQRSRSEVRSRLLTYVEPPDTTLSTVPEVFVLSNGHTEYQFRGDDGKGAGSLTGGSYRMDAVSGEILIYYALPPNAASAPRIPAEEQRKLAAAFMQKHFQGFSPTEFVQGGDPDYESDTIPLSVGFGRATRGLAIVPQHAYMHMDPRTGRVSHYSEMNVPFVVSPIPDINRDQAVQLAQAWVRANFCANPADAQLVDGSTIATGNPVELELEVSDEMDQSLAYIISFPRVVVKVDGHSGAAVGTDGWAGAGPGKGGSGVGTLPLNQRDHFLSFRRGGGGTISARQAIRIGSSAYIWSGVMHLIGVQMASSRTGVTLRSGRESVRLPVANRHDNARPAALQRRDGIYIPTAGLQKLGIRFAQDSTSLTLLDLGAVDAPLRPVNRTAPNAPALPTPSGRRLNDRARSHP